MRKLIIGPGIKIERKMMQVRVDQYERIKQLSERSGRKLIDITDMLLTFALDNSELAEKETSA